VSLVLTRRIAVAVVLAALIACSWTAPASGFRSMTWNIGGSPTSPAGRQFNLNDVQAVVGTYSPDVLALQEVCSWQAQSIGQSLGYYWHETTIGRFNDGRTGSGGACNYGNALLSKTDIPLDGRYRTDLLAPSEGCKYDAYQGTGYPECRLDMGALITPSGASVVRAASAHVGTAGEPYTAPYDQSLELSRLVNDAGVNASESATSGRALMMGDYNVRPEDSRMAPRVAALGYLDAGGSVAGQPCASTPGCAFTYPSGGAYGAPTIKLDYLYYKNLRLDAHQVPEPLTSGHEASDHRPVVADFSSLLAPPPTVTLGTPANGSAQNSSSPRFGGTASTASGSSAVTVKIYVGSGASGTPVQSIGGAPVGGDGSWSTAPAPLADGIYTARAEQTDSAGQVGSSAPSTFTVDTAAPRVTLTSPANGSSAKASTPTFAGAAGTAPGDATSVTVKIFSGTSATGTQIQTLSATVSNGTWSVAGPALAAGTYTARAEQADAAGNRGLSLANTFTIRRGAGKAAAALVAPRVSSVRVIPSRFRVGSVLPRISRRSVGTTLSFRLSAAAKVTASFARAQRGRLVGGRCVAASRRNRDRRACTRWLSAASLRLNGVGGSNRVLFQGRLSRRRTLRPGWYTVAITATDWVGNRSRPAIARFTIVPSL
jgi:endonuclease/exonuclease/phosphatase family metal-dependent hydrolase